MMNTIRGVKIAALVPLLLMGLVSLGFGVGESAGGEIGGLGHLAQVLVLGLIAWLGWRQSLLAGILLLAVTLFRLVAIVIELFLRPPHVIWNWGSLVGLILPLAVSGAIFLWAGLIERKMRNNPAGRAFGDENE